MNKSVPGQALDEETIALSQFLDAMFRRPAKTTEEIDGLARPALEVPPMVPEAPDPNRPFPVPPWAGERFEVMIIDVGILKLTLPLVDLGSVVRFPEELTGIPGQAPWLLGVFNHQGGNVRVLDTARRVMPENASLDEVKYEHVVLINHGRWGLACCAVSEVFHLEPHEVRWRDRRGRRPWLAGTVIPRMSGMLDVPEFTRTLEMELNTTEKLV